METGLEAQALVAQEALGSEVLAFLLVQVPQFSEHSLELGVAQERDQLVQLQLLGVFNGEE